MRPKQRSARTASSGAELFGPFAEHWTQLAPEVLRPVSLFPRHPFLMARLGLLGFPSATSFAHFWFRSAADQGAVRRTGGAFHSRAG